MAKRGMSTRRNKNTEMEMDMEEKEAQPMTESEIEAEGTKAEVEEKTMEQPAQTESISMMEMLKSMMESSKRMEENIERIMEESSKRMEENIERIMEDSSKRMEENIERIMEDNSKRMEENIERKMEDNSKRIEENIREKFKAKFVVKLGKNEVIIVEPNDKHYYQPRVTLVGGGIKDLSQSYCPMSSVLPNNALWLQDAITEFKPESNKVGNKAGNEITYEYMIVALGLELHYGKIKGLLESLAKPDSGVCSNYSPWYVNRTLESLKKFKGGNAIFTFPKSPVKCAGAPQKACYISEDYFRKTGKHAKAKVKYKTSLPVIFAVKCACAPQKACYISEDYFRKTGKRAKAKVKYKTSLPVIFAVKCDADSLNSICNKRNIEVGYRQERIEIDPAEKIATFRNLDKPEETFIVPYELLHVTPPMGAPAVLKTCPLVIEYWRCVMAEFDYNRQPVETLPINQSKENYITYVMKKDIIHQKYWYLVLRGHWTGPALVYKLRHLGRVWNSTPSPLKRLFVNLL